MARVTDKTLRELYAASPVPVWEIPRNLFRRFFKVSGKEYRPTIRGSFVISDGQIIPPLCILIVSNQPLYRKVSTFFHERGHHEHWERGCDCMEDPGALAEAHADAYMLGELLSREMWKPLDDEIKTMNLCLVDTIFNKGEHPGKEWLDLLRQTPEYVAAEISNFERSEPEIAAQYNRLKKAAQC